MVTRNYTVRDIAAADREKYDRWIKAAEGRGDADEAKSYRESLSKWEAEQGQEREVLACAVCGDTWQHEVEDEAYSVAAALLMPYRPLFNHVNAGLPLEEFPTPAPISWDCRLFRVKRAGLWRVYKKRTGTGG